MQERPVVVREGGNKALMFGIVAIVAIFAIALVYVQPWSGTHTTIVNQQPGANGNSSGSSSDGTSAQGGSSSAGGASGNASGSTGTSH